MDVDGGIKLTGTLTVFRCRIVLVAARVDVCVTWSVMGLETNGWLCLAVSQDGEK